MNILIIANSQFKGGASGGDKIHESFKKYWPNCTFRVWQMLDIDYKPFALCYLHRLVLAVIIACIEPHHYDVVYSASDFLPDSLPAAILRFRGHKWIAGFYLKAFRENRVHYFSQKLVKWLIDKFAHMVIVTNPTMYDIFPNKKKTWINGGIDLELAGLSDEPKIYDAVFCGRIHPSKGIDELIDIWSMVRAQNPDASLALIGDGDLGLDYLKKKIQSVFGLNKWGGITLFGYMGDERYNIYKRSKVVLYPTPLKYDHFSMAPVEAMACGCPMLHFDTPVLRSMFPDSRIGAISNEDFADKILQSRNCHKEMTNNKYAFEWASQFDYKKQSLRVYNDIRKELCVS